MFGLFRTFLALAVVFEHLGGSLTAGPYAVFGFFCLSGYLMTFIMHETYGYNLHGIGKYFLNRWLRIFPPYWCAAAITVVIVLLTGSMSRDFHGDIGMPDSLLVWLQNIFLLLSIHTDTRLVPPAWALTTECFYYLLIGLGVSRFAWTTAIWLAVSAVYTVYLVVGDAPWSYRYFTVASASLPFALGASLFHWRNSAILSRKLISGERAFYVLACAGLANYFYARLFGVDAIMGVHFYANLAVIFLLINNLGRRVSFPWLNKSLDKKIGDTSYPIYLLHYQAGLIVAALFSYQRGTTEMLWTAVPLVFVLAIVTNKLIEDPIDKMRQAVKSIVVRPPAG